MRRLAILFITFICLLLHSCDVINFYPDFPIDPPTDTTVVDNPSDTSVVNPPAEDPSDPSDPSQQFIPIDFTFGHEGLAYIWDESVIPEITVRISLEQWNALLARYDENNHNVDFFHCDVEYRKGSDVWNITDAGIRIRGNTSRRRPEGNSGQKHVKDGADWHHCHFSINLRKYVKDDAHEIKGIRKMNLKWFKDDPCYVREMYCYDLFRRYNIWTAANNVYCRLWIHVEGDSAPAYFGVYEMIEPVDDKFIKKRKDYFVEHKGNLWKCRYPAFLNSVDAYFGLDEDTGEDFTYEYKGEPEAYAAALEQLRDFILKLNGKSDESFYKWINEVCDVELLLKTYAVNVAVGMWDDHWNNGNNFYLYFNSTDKYNYQVFFIPYDYDNTLGTSIQCGAQSDAGRQDPYRWGDKGVLMNRMMDFDDFREIYHKAFEELLDPSRGLFDMDASVARILDWQSRIMPYISNDTGEDMFIYDEPAYWGHHGEYRLMDTGPNNYFRVKATSLQ